MNKAFIIFFLTVCMTSILLESCAPKSRPLSGTNTNENNEKNTPASGGVKSVPGTPGGSGPAVIPVLQQLGLNPTKVRTSMPAEMPGTMVFDIEFNGDKKQTVQLRLTGSSVVTLSPDPVTQLYVKDGKFICNEGGPYLSNCKHIVLTFTLKNPARPGTEEITIDHKKLNAKAVAHLYSPADPGFSKNLLGKEDPIEVASQIINVIYAKGGQITFQQFHLERISKRADENGEKIEGTKVLNNNVTVFVKIVGHLGTDENGKPLSVSPSATFIDGSKIVGITVDGKLQLKVQINVNSDNQTKVLEFLVAPAEQIDAIASASLTAVDQALAPERAAPATDQAPAPERAAPATDQAPAPERAAPATEQAPASERAAPAASQVAANPEESAGMECKTLYPIMGEFLSRHLTQKKLTPELEQRTINRFIKALDPSKFHFMESDVITMKSKLTNVFSRLGSKKCDDIIEAQKLYETRVNESQVLARKTLNDDFKINENTIIIFDPTKRAYAKNRTELEDLQIRYIQFQISDYLARNINLLEAKKQLVHHYDVALKDVLETKRTDLFAIFLSSFASALDPHSDFLSEDALVDFDRDLRLSLVGIGVTLSSQDGYPVIVDLTPGGAAAKSGDLEPKDTIIGIAEGDSSIFKPVKDIPLRDVSKLIRGPKGTKVKLSVLSQTKTPSSHTVELFREKIDLKDEAAKLSYIDKNINGKDLKIGVINLPLFYSDLENGTRSCSEDVKKLINEANGRHVDGIILDLSNNGGGFLVEAVKLAGLFIKNGNIVSTQDSEGKIKKLADLDKTLNYAGPMVVLTSRRTASASEIVAGALQDYHRAVIAGSDHTFGKGSVQGVFGAIKVTIGMFFTPDGDSTQVKGVLSDVRFPSPYTSMDYSEDALDYALPKKSIPNFLSPEGNDINAAVHYVPVTANYISELQKASLVRVAKDPEFIKIETELKESEKKNGVIKLADFLKKNRENKEKEKAKKIKKSKDGGEDSDYLTRASMKEASNVLVDLILLEKKSAHSP